MVGSSRSLTLAVRDQLCQAAPPSGTFTYAGGYGLGLTLRTDCDVTFDGRPNPGCGKNFFAVHHGRRTNQLLTGDESMFGVTVTISARANEPFDRIGPNLVDWAQGVMALADQVWACIYGNQWGDDNGGSPNTIGVMNRANNYLGAVGTVYQWTEALYPTGEPEATPVRADWFSSTDEQQPMRGAQQRPARAAGMPYDGLSVQVQFTGAKRLQRTADMGA